MVEKITLTLQTPISYQGREYSELKFRRPTPSELLRLRRPNLVAASTLLIATVTGVPQKAIMKMEVSDFNEAALIMARLISPSEEYEHGQ